MPERTGDMDNVSKIVVLLQEDGDIIVGVVEEQFGKLVSASVEFCTPGSGGGLSPATHEALRNLIEAIRKDSTKGRAAFIPH